MTKPRYNEQILVQWMSLVSRQSLGTLLYRGSTVITLGGGVQLFFLYKRSLKLARLEG